MKEFMLCMNKYATFSGRASRREYWMFVLISYVILIPIYAVGMVGLFMENKALAIVCFLLYFVISLALVLPSLAVLARRLHDINKSGWYFFISFIPIVGPFILLYYLITAGDGHENMYGPSPYATDANGMPVAQSGVVSAMAAPVAEPTIELAIPVNNMEGAAVAASPDATTQQGVMPTAETMTNATNVDTAMNTVTPETVAINNMDAGASAAAPTEAVPIVTTDTVGNSTGNTTTTEAKQSNILL